MTRRARLLGLVATIAVALPAQAQEPQAAIDAAPEATAAACELHVWPAAAMRFSHQGMEDNVRWGTYGGWGTPQDLLMNSKRDGTDVLPENPAELLARAEQATLFAAAPDGSALGLPGHRLVVHDVALTSRGIRGTPGRLATGSAPCYAELVLDTLIFSNEWGNGQNLKSLYRFRDFGTGDTPARSFGAWVQTKLVIEPEDLPAKFDEARAEMRAAFTNNVALFGAAMTTNATTGSTKRGKKK